VPKTVLVTPAQRRAAEALVEWYEATEQPVASSVRQIATSEPLSQESKSARSVHVYFDTSAAIDLLPSISNPAAAEAVSAYNAAVHDLVAAYDMAIPNWSQSLAMSVLRLEMFGKFRRSAAARRHSRRVSDDSRSRRANDPGVSPETPEPQAGRR